MQALKCKARMYSTSIVIFEFLLGLVCSHIAFFRVGRTTYAMLCSYIVLIFEGKHSQITRDGNPDLRLGLKLHFSARFRHLRVDLKVDHKD